MRGTGANPAKTRPRPGHGQDPAKTRPRPWPPINPASTKSHPVRHKPRPLRKGQTMDLHQAGSGCLVIALTRFPLVAHASRPAIEKDSRAVPTRSWLIVFTR